MNRYLLLIALSIIIVLEISCIPSYYPKKWSNSRTGLTTPKNEMSFDVLSDSLKDSFITPILETPIQKGKNIIWCASFLCAWKILQIDILKEPIKLTDSLRYFESLNVSLDPRKHIPQQSLFTATGYVNQNLIRKMQNEIRVKFPNKELPLFPQSSNNSFLIYAYLESNVSFPIPYFQNRNPLVFTDSNGKKINLSSFGIRSEDKYAYFELRKQPRVLYQKNKKDVINELAEFVIDINSNSYPNQIILACIEPAETLLKTISKVEKKISDATNKNNWFYDIGSNDVLIVPDMFWKISHCFKKIQGKNIINKELKGTIIEIAKQDIYFRLDRSGAELKSESMILLLPIPNHYIFNKPFLLYIKKRDTLSPYFVMWVDNTELLTKYKTL